MSTSLVSTSLTIVRRVALLLLVWCIANAAPVQAQITVSPRAGISGEAQPAVAAAVGMSFGAVRSEVELGWAFVVAPSGELRIEPDPGPLPTIPPPSPGAVSPNDPAGGSQTPGQIPGAPPAPRS